MHELARHAVGAYVPQVGICRVDIEVLVLIKQRVRLQTDVHREHTYAVLKPTDAAAVDTPENMTLLNQTKRDGRVRITDDPIARDMLLAIDYHLGYLTLFLDKFRHLGFRADDATHGAD